MSEAWKKTAVKIGSIICTASKRCPQLIPLHTSWVNFAGKHQVELPNGTQTFIVIPAADFDRLVSTVKRQDEEIKALEYRITTLLRPE